METLKAEALRELQTGWGAYVARVRAFPPADRQCFVEQQGYMRLADLLAHVIAWWEEGLPAVEHLLEDPNWTSPDYDVDAFNAAAVERFSGWDEDAVVALFEQHRREWIDWIERIPEAAWQNPNLCQRVEIELIGHLDEHRIGS